MEYSSDINIVIIFFNVKFFYLVWFAIYLTFNIIAFKFNKKAIQCNLVHNIKMRKKTYVFAFQIAQPTVPERMFKVVFVGDSGVGKSSFIHQFCNNEFKSSFSATIGNFSI